MAQRSWSHDDDTVSSAGLVLSDIESGEPRLSAVADLDVVDPEGESDDARASSGGRGENIELVAAVFRLAGNPKFQDVRLRAAAKTSHCADPTHRALAVERAKRLTRSFTW